MDILSFAKELAQNLAEQAASYRVGQTALRYIDRALWVLEKSARWAVPPPIDQDDQTRPELIRPLPWVFFLAVLLMLRITRESLSIINLTLGKPPLRSADVVMYIQGKRRYLRTLKYQGSRAMRARSAAAAQQSAAVGAAGVRQAWYSSVYSLFEVTMCFRSRHNYGNNNTTSLSNNDEILLTNAADTTEESTDSEVDDKHKQEEPASTNLNKTPNDPISQVNEVEEKSPCNENDTTVSEENPKVTGDIPPDTNKAIVNNEPVKSDSTKTAEVNNSATEPHDDTKVIKENKNQFTTEESSKTVDASDDATIIKINEETDKSKENEIQVPKKKPCKTKEVNDDATKIKGNDDNTSCPVIVITSPAEVNDANTKNKSNEDMNNPKKSENDVPKKQPEKETKQSLSDPPSKSKPVTAKEESMKFIQNEKNSPQKNPKSSKKFVNGQVSKGSSKKKD